MNQKYNDSLTFKIDNELDLHVKVVSFLKKKLSKQHLYCYISKKRILSHKKIIFVTLQI